MFKRYPELYERALVMSFEPNVIVKYRLLDPKIGTLFIFQCLTKSGTATISFGGLTSFGCKINALPESFCKIASDLNLLQPLDWFTLMVTNIIL
jgi:hypothetical protein